ncbi:rhomboid family intramembrane serine protease [Candidatus Bathyarchaeota archaeon]|nr:rhomboid family intramembrane serine protease [Candidatus Bathyarchaeota archaeon]
MLPLKDLNRTFSTPHVNRILLITNILIFTVYWLSTQGIVFDGRFTQFFDTNFIMTPAVILNGQQLYTLVTSMFIHATWIHLLGNMLYLFVFGDNVEDVFGHAGYLTFYLVCGLAAAFTHILSVLYAPAMNSVTGLTFSSDLTEGLIGASGAIAGVLGAYLVLYPKAYILTIVLIVILPIPAVVFLGFWFILQWLYIVFNMASEVAYFAHIGGFITGMVLALAIGLNRKKALRERRRL